MNEYHYKDIYIGLEESFTVEVTEKMMDNFLEISGDINPLHNDSVFANEFGHSSRVVYGMLTSSFLSTLAGVYLPGKYSLIQNLEIQLPKPVYIGDILTISGKVVDKSDLYNMIVIKVTITNQKNQKVVRGKMQIGVQK